MENKIKILFSGLFEKNPVFVLILGLCPTLAVTTSLENGLGMGLSALCVLIFSNTIISSMKILIPKQVRIPSYIVIIATFVTIISMIMQAYLPSLNKQLGIYVPLIVVNCIILGRAEGFAKNHKVFDSFLDGLGMGIGFTLALSIIGLIREILGTSSVTFFGKTLISFGLPKTVMMILPPGALLTIGLLIAGLNYWKQKE